MRISVRVLDPRLADQLPSYATPGSAGLDLRACIDQALTVEAGQAVRAVLAAGRYAWLQVLRGGVSLSGVLLGTSDGAAVSEERELTIEAEGAAEVMLFDLG